MFSNVTLIANNKWKDVYEADFDCFKLPRSFECLPWATEGNGTIFVIVDGLWICNQTVISRKHAKSAGINPGKVTRDRFFM
jgi:hypothetical protein